MPNYPKVRNEMYKQAPLSPFSFGIKQVSVICRERPSFSSDILDLLYAGCIISSETTRQIGHPLKVAMSVCQNSLTRNEPM
jgi:hypothetical protein